MQPRRTFSFPRIFSHPPNEDNKIGNAEIDSRGLDKKKEEKNYKALEIVSWRFYCLCSGESANARASATATFFSEGNCAGLQQNSIVLRSSETEREREREGE